jgi:probable F420-dependent oxidoreductase
MRVSYGLPHVSCPPNPAFVTAAGISALSQAAEAAGFDAIHVLDHPAPGQGWREAGGHDGVDPFVALSAVAMATSRVRLLTYLTILTYRSPFVTAKAAATLDVLSGGRLTLGVGAGYMKSEFAALGVDFATRNERFDESIEVLVKAFTGEPVVHAGRFFNARGNTVQPRPLQQPHPPVWVGGNSKLARRRAVAFGQGWMPMPNPQAQARFSRAPALETIDDLVRMIGELRAMASVAGRSEPIDIMFPLNDAHGTGESLAGLGDPGALHAAGVTWVGVNGRGETLDEAIEHIGTTGALLALHDR